HQTAAKTQELFNDLSLYPATSIPVYFMESFWRPVVDDARSHICQKQIWCSKGLISFLSHVIILARVACAVCDSAGAKRLCKRLLKSTGSP
ncbi:MAG: hypothetical protein QNL02_04935, partial [Paracoccaceae bacterium]